ncbi:MULTISPECIES: nitrilase-related carbon-nitrogen hydrolase [Actinomadura]|uniref:Predicted amidohydrolase n=1 Tax=Actinomadura madurae TaxID=1993 RepID=A0A1I5WD29_9ACTN|nr:nitrilase-related carbon-nitrogen hydrolase [Actinomadura madurae]SFQ17620.1 Predicted amidohydrolase [Actinomadura madurae]SPT64593.1 (R)-stereoselective amidase [Actinomadura madurae]
MRIAVGQFASTEDWQTNLKTCMGLIDEAVEGGADLLVLPEDSLALFIDEPERIAGAAQPLDGPFVTGLRAHTEGSRTTVVAGVHEPAGDGKVFNTLVAVRDGELAAVYRKVHLYDAFGARESDRVTPGDGEPVVLDCAGWRVGLMTCYDVRFPEMARLLVDAGAQVLAVPAAWVRGPAKEWHWQVMVTARALENTCYVAASGECGRRNIGSSMVVDPLGIVRDRLGERPGLLWAIADRDELADARGRLPVLANRRFRVDPSIRPVEESA